MYETRNETNGPLVTCGERRVLAHLTFRLPGGESDKGRQCRPKAEAFSTLLNRPFSLRAECV